MMKYLDLDGARYIVATIQNLLDGKVSKDGNKVLSTNDYTTTEKNKLAGIAASATKVETSTTIGNLKINGAEKQIIPLMSAASSSAAGKAGLVPAPAQSKHTSFLRGDGTWVIPTNTTYTNATTSKDGLMSSADKTKLDGIKAGDSTPLANGVANAGTSNAYAREDHKHPLQTTISGNAGSATKLQTARTIALSGAATGTATSFNGTTNITIPVTSLDASKLTGTTDIDTTGNAATATKLQTARTINGVNFDGTKNITITASVETTELESEDLDDIRTEGEYYATENNEVTSKPSSVKGFYLKIYRAGSLLKMQELTDNNGEKYIRRWVGLSWSSWEKITYSLATSSSSGLLSSSDYIKLSKVTAAEMGYLDGVTSSIQTQLNSKASTSNVLTKNNTTSYTPTNDYHPATKKYVDENSGSKFDGSYELTRDAEDSLTFYINIPDLTDPSVLEGKLIHIYVATEIELFNNQKVIINNDENNYMYFNPTHLLGEEIYAATVEKAFQDETKYLFNFGKRMGKNIIKESQMPIKTLNPNESASFSFSRIYMGERWCFLFLTPKATGESKSKMKVEILLDGTVASSYTREYTFDDEGILNQGTELIPLRFTSSYDKKKIEVKATCVSGQIEFPSQYGINASPYIFTGAFIETKNNIFGSSEDD